MRNDELGRRSLGDAALVVDRDLRVTVWNPGAEDLLGARAEEAMRRRLSELDIGLPVREIVPLLRRAMSGAPARGQITVEGTNRRGRTVSMRVQAHMLTSDAGEPDGGLLTLNHGR